VKFSSKLVKFLIRDREAALIRGKKKYARASKKIFVAKNPHKKSGKLN
jgi:hypothetical protein